MTLRAQVRNGRLELSEPTDLPEGSIVELEPVIEAYSLDDFGDEERARVQAIAERGEMEYAAGRYIDADVWLAQRRAARQR